jgi:hypothetical protein
MKSLYGGLLRICCPPAEDALLLAREPALDHREVARARSSCRPEPQAPVCVCTYMHTHTHTHRHTETHTDTHTDTHRHTHKHTHTHQSRRDRHTVLAKSCCSLDVRQPARAVSVSRRATSMDVSLTSPQPRLPASEPSACLLKILKSQRPIISTI